MGEMQDSLAIAPVAGPINATICPPGSKSLTNRALICAALAEGESTLTGALVSDDTRVMIDALGELGISIAEENDGRTLQVEGCAGQIPEKIADLWVGNSGTTIRFLTALAALGGGRYRLDGVTRMRERPIGDLLEALNQLGAKAWSESSNGCPPVVVEGDRLAGGVATVRGNISSQYLSGLLMIAPLANGPTEMSVDGALVSLPYVRMTLRVMEAFGASMETNEAFNRFGSPGGQKYTGCNYAVEPDASAASYFWAAAAIVGGSVTVDRLNTKSLQGDVAIVDLLERMGCQVDRKENAITVSGRPLRGICVDMNAMSDMVQTIAVVALFAEGPTEITGVAHNRHKETDRITALATELRKLGAVVEEREAGLRIIPGPRIVPGSPRRALIETYDDHRMAMSLTLAGLKIPGVQILDPGCTAKTYPDFFQDLATVVGANDGGANE